MQNAEGRFYFALPRLISLCTGGNAERSEKNGLEAFIAGALVHLTVFAFAFERCLSGFSLWQQLLLLLPLAILVWLFWLNLIYANSWVIKLLRAIGLMRDLPQGRAQGILVGIVTTAFALHLLHARGWTHIVGAVWIAVAVLNLLASLVLGAWRAVNAETDRGK